MREFAYPDERWELWGAKPGVHHSDGPHPTRFFDDGEDDEFTSRPLGFTADLDDGIAKPVTALALEEPDVVDAEIMCAFADAGDRFEGLPCLDDCLATPPTTPGCRRAALASRCCDRHLTICGRQMRPCCDTCPNPRSDAWRNR